MYRFKSITNEQFADNDCGTVGLYFITLNAEHHKLPLSEFKKGRLILTQAGKIVEQVFLNLEQHFSNLSIDAYVIMPNHIHAIIRLSELPSENLIVHGVSRFEMSFGLMVGRLNPFLIQGSLFHAINWFKASSFIELRKNNIMDFVWKRGYYDYPISNETSYNNIKSYIMLDPSNWEDDIDNPNNDFRELIYTASTTI